MNTIRAIVAHLHRAFASQLNTTIAWAVIIVLSGAIVIEYADRLL